MNIKKEIIKIIQSKLSSPSYKIWLFGSRATGHAVNRSDYDVGIEAEGKIDLALLGEIKEMLENLPILQTIDLVDLNRVSDDFKKIALQKAKLLYERTNQKNDT